MAKVNIVFHSMYGHIYRMAEAEAQGAREVPGVEVGLYQVKETLPDELIESIGAKEAKALFAHLPIATADTLAESDGIIFGTPTRFGNMTAQMRTLLDSTGALWASGSLIGKVASVFTSSNTQHGGQETTILTFIPTLLHQGMIVVGTPYSEKRQMLDTEITGGSPYGASTVAGENGRRMPTENELGIARCQGKHVAQIVKRLFG